MQLMTFHLDTGRFDLSSNITKPLLRFRRPNRTSNFGRTRSIPLHQDYLTGSHLKISTTTNKIQRVNKITLSVVSDAKGSKPLVESSILDLLHGSRGAVAMLASVRLACLRYFSFPAGKIQIRRPQTFDFAAKSKQTALFPPSHPPATFPSPDFTGQTQNQCDTTFRSARAPPTPPPLTSCFPGAPFPYVKHRAKVSHLMFTPFFKMAFAIHHEPTGSLSVRPMLAIKAT